ncbi:hypothetical protein [Archangium lipolyticum]|uniref:hypothetical protein n=1 Tax=Archangium lipolyticum TaxID=2970465 RepID=UPI00214A4C8A|nr:hypothetical protein [Archangium lipolyticum]
MKRLVFAVSSVVVLWASGCSNTLEQEDFCTEYAKATCETSVKCCTSRSLDLASCQSGWKALCERLIIAGIEAKKSNYDASAAAECMGDIRARQDECKMSQDTDGSCNRAITGTISEGGDCKDFPSSCAQGLTCYLRVSNETTKGTCVKRAGEGQICADAPCETGFYCDYSTQLCKREAALGADCSNTRCSRDAYCDSETKKCMELKDVGAACGSSSQCKSFQCTSGTCTANDSAATGFCFVPTEP